MPGQLHDRPRDDVVVLVAAEAVDELAGDLEHVDREPAQVGQRRVPGAEVVDRDPDAEGLEPPEGRGRRLAVLHEDRLGDLQDETARVEARLGERRGDRVDDAGRPAEADRLTVMVSGWFSTATQRAAWRQASCSTWEPISTMSPVSSASAMNASGPSALLGAASGPAPRRRWAARCAG